MDINTAYEIHGDISD